ncbi:MAG: NmrA family NAD(P)-binding protein [Janthinobacterium lividum]
METTILVAGATGDLGGKIIKALIAKGATVHALVRKSSDAAKVEMLTNLGAKVMQVDLADAEALTQACQGVSCVVSALAGLREVIVDAQLLLLNAAVAAGVPRFIPSDFATDFTKLPEGENRNFDLRKEFHTHLSKANIAATSILNGAFTDILRYNTPFYNLKNNTVGFWGDADWKVDFTTKDNTADFTAAAALDAATPEILRIASFQISANEIAAIGTEVKKVDFKLIPMGSLASLSEHNKSERAAHPEGENQLYTSWQQSQYMHSMFSVQNNPLDNEHYPDIKWATALEVISRI